MLVPTFVCTARTRPSSTGLGARLSAAVALAIATLLVPLSAIAVPFFQGLGPLGADGTTPYTISGMSPDGGTLVGYALGSVPGTFRAFRWTAAEGYTIPSVNGTPLTGAGGVSSGGDVIAGYVDNVAAVRWTSSSSIPLGDLPGGSTWTVPEGISGDGSVIIGTSQSGAGREAFRWTETTGILGLGDLPGGPNESIAYAVSLDGTTVVGVGDIDTNSTAFRWTEATGMVAIDPIAGASLSAALAVSADGSAVVGWARGSTGGAPFRWTEATGAVVLAPFWNRSLPAEAAAVSGDGTRVVGSLYSLAFVWDAEGKGVASVRDVLVQSGIDMTGWSLTSAEAISADGRLVAGFGWGPNGRQAWMAELPLWPVPEPSTAFLLLSGLAILARRCAGEAHRLLNAR